MLCLFYPFKRDGNRRYGKSINLDRVGDLFEIAIYPSSINFSFFKSIPFNFNCITAIITSKNNFWGLRIEDRLLTIYCVRQSMNNY